MSARPTPRAGAGVRGRLRARRRTPGRPSPLPRWPLVAAVALAAAALSLLWSAVPQFDPQGWVLWGREIVGPGRFDTSVYPSFKPLPLLLTVPLAASGGAAPALWLVVARAGALLGLAGAFRLAARGGGALGGAVAVLAIVLLPGFVGLATDGHLEPLLLGLLVGAFERHLAGRRGQALVLLALVGLGRVEAWPLAWAYGVVVVREDRRRAPLVVLGLVAVPLAWFAGDWLGSGNAWRGGQLAREVARVSHLHHGAEAQVLLDATRLLVGPLWAALALGLALSVRRRRALVTALTATAAGWLAVDVALAHRGYPSDARYMVPAGGLLCVAAGVSVGELVRVVARALERLRGGLEAARSGAGAGERGGASAGEREPSGGPSRWPRPGAAQVVALAALAAVLLPACLPRARTLPRQALRTERTATVASRVDRALDRVGGRDALLAEGAPPVTANQYLQARLAWDLGVPVGRVWRRCPPEVVFTFRGNPLWHALRAGAGRGLVRLRVLAHDGPLEVLHVRPGPARDWPWVGYGSPLMRDAACLRLRQRAGGGAPPLPAARAASSASSARSARSSGSVASRG